MKHLTIKESLEVGTGAYEQVDTVFLIGSIFLGVSILGGPWAVASTEINAALNPSPTNDGKTGANEQDRQ